VYPPRPACVLKLVAGRLQYKRSSSADDEGSGKITVADCDRVTVVAWLHLIFAKPSPYPGNGAPALNPMALKRPPPLESIGALLSMLPASCLLVRLHDSPAQPFLPIGRLAATNSAPSV